MTKRRDFLRALGFVGVALGYPVSRAQAVEKRVPSNNMSLLDITGTVSDGKSGIAGVCVTDGINIVQTNELGEYTLPTNSEAEFVYISVPSGYEFPAEKHIAKFYQPIQGESVQADFTLKKLKEDDSKHVFVVWADTQIIDEEDAAKLKSTTAPDLKELVKNYPNKTLFHGIGCGDLVWDHFELFEDYKEAVAETGVPFFQVLGNHDMDNDARSDELSSRTFKSHFGPTYYSFNRGKVHYVVLDDVFFLGASKNYIGYITEQQLKWLEKDLKFVKPGSTVVVSLHIPTNTGVKRRKELKEAPTGGTVANRKRLYKLLESFKVHIMSGHTHFNEKWSGANITEHVHGTVCGAWWTGPICFDGTPSGYGVYEVDGDNIQWYHKSTGHPKEYQMRVYTANEVKKGDRRMAVNVWNWDEYWQISWYEDDVKQGELFPITSYDPLSQQLHLGNLQPKKHTWVEPHLTDHLFYFTPSESARKVKVEAKDQFGNVYSQEVDLAILVE